MLEASYSNWNAAWNFIVPTVTQHFWPIISPFSTRLPILFFISFQHTWWIAWTLTTSVASCLIDLIELEGALNRPFCILYTGCIACGSWVGMVDENSPTRPPFSCRLDWGQRDPKLRGTSFPPSIVEFNFCPKLYSRNPRFLLADCCPKNFRTSCIFIFHVLPPLAFLFRFPRPQTARFPSISHGPSNSPSAGSAGGFRLLTVPCTEKCSSKKFGKCYTIIIYPSGPKTIKKNVFLEKMIIWVWICSQQFQCTMF